MSGEIVHLQQMILKTGKKISESALTLIELLIVLSIMGLFLIFSAPLFTRFSESTQLDATARNISSALVTARGYAITKYLNNADYYVVFDNTAPHNYFISADGTNVVAGEKIHKLPTGIYFNDPGGGDAIGFTSDIAHFKSTGELDESSNDTSVYVADGTGAGAESKQITVERTTGRVRIN